jgi:hypothetical protein
MKNSFRIETKQTEFTTGVKAESKQDVLDYIALFDLIPPFKVFNEKDEDVTAQIMEYAQEKNYRFVDKKKVIALIPAELKAVMNKHYKKTVQVSLKTQIPVKLIPTNDIKSLEGFYEIWEHMGITIGSSDNARIFIDSSDQKCPVYLIKQPYDFTKKELLASSAKDFTDTFIKTIK